MGALLKSEMIKAKKTAFTKMHIFIPIIGILVFYGFYFITDYDEGSRVVGFFQLLSIGFTLLISVVCSMNSNTEMQAGNYFHLLTVAGRKEKGIYAKALFLLLCGLYAVLAVSTGFGIANRFLLSDYSTGLSVFIIGGLLLFFSNIFLYLFNVFLSLRFGGNIAIGTGIIGCLITTLMLTGLGDGIWIFIPYAWATRFTNIYVRYVYGYDSIGSGEFMAAMGICILFTVILFYLVKKWFAKWEGRVSGE